MNYRKVFFRSKTRNYVYLYWNVW